MSNDLKSAEVLLLSGKKKKSELLNDLSHVMALAAAQDLQIDKLKKEIDQKNQEIQHLKRLLSSMTPSLIKSDVQDEEIVAEAQLRRLKNIASERDLTLEEARKFEIFSKIKQVVEKTKPIVPQWTALPESTPNQDLIQIAEQSTYKEQVLDESSDDI